MKTDQRKQLTMKTPVMVACGVSDPGRTRDENEDAIHLDERGNFILLADGMGGHERGAEASQTALDILQTFFTPEVLRDELMDITDGCGIPSEVSCFLSLIDSAVNRANEEIYARNQKMGLQRYMGTTALGLIAIPDGPIVWFHVGDSRIYRWRDATLDCLTRDHSAITEWENKGRVGAKPAKNIITRAIGPAPAVSPSTGWGERQADDIFILCSDGLTDMIDEAKMISILQEDNEVERIADHLVAAANEAGGRDNVSVIVCKV